MRYKIKGDTLPIIIYHVNKGKSIICDSAAINWIEPVMEMKTSSGDTNLLVFFNKIFAKIISKSICHSNPERNVWKSL